MPAEAIVAAIEDEHQALIELRDWATQRLEELQPLRELAADFAGEHNPQPTHELPKPAPTALPAAVAEEDQSPAAPRAEPDASPAATPPESDPEPDPEPDQEPVGSIEAAALDAAGIDPDDEEEPDPATPHDTTVLPDGEPKRPWHRTYKGDEPTPAPPPPPIQTKRTPPRPKPKAAKPAAKASGDLTEQILRVVGQVGQARFDDINLAIVGVSTGTIRTKVQDLVKAGALNATGLTKARRYTLPDPTGQASDRGRVLEAIATDPGELTVSRLALAVDLADDEVAAICQDLLGAGDVQINRDGTYSPAATGGGPVDADLDAGAEQEVG